MTLLPVLVSKSELEARNSITSGMEAVTQVGGPSLGGVLVQTFGATNALIVDTISYLMSAALLATLPSRPRTTRVPSGRWHR
jgi:predicted MFS family arabinose efflux permease